MLDDRSCVINGMVGKPEDTVIGSYMQKFGEIELIKSRTPEDASFIVTYKAAPSAVVAMNKSEHVIDGNSVNIVPFRYGDEECDRKLRVVILEGLPKMTEGQLAAKFEDEGVALARVCPTSPNIGYILLTKQNMAQRIVKSSPIAIPDTYHDEDDRRPYKVTAFSFAQKLGKLQEGLRISISQELELLRTPATNLGDFYGLKWLKPKPPVTKISPEKVTLIDKSVEKSKRKSLSDIPPRIDHHRASITPRIAQSGKPSTPVKRPRKVEPPPIATSANLLGNIMGDISVEKDPAVLERRSKKIQEFKSGEQYITFLRFADDTDRNIFRTPDISEKLVKERTFYNRAFEWQHKINEWVSEYKKSKAATPPPDEPEEKAPFAEDDPFNPDHDYPDQMDNEPSSPPGIPGIEPEEVSATSPSVTTASTAAPLLNAKKSNLLMPSRSATRLDGGRVRKRPQPVTGTSTKDTPTMDGGSTAANTLKSVLSSLSKDGLLQKTLQQLSSKAVVEPPAPVVVEEVIEDPKISIVKNPPMELRKLLRKLRIDKDDLKTLLDIPLTIISDQNVLALIQQKNESSDHVDRKDPGTAFHLHYH